MSKAELCDSENDSGSSSGEPESTENCRGGGTQKMTEYEEQRLKRIEENRKRMEDLGLSKIANSFMGSLQNISTKKKSDDRKGKRKVKEEDDEEYQPPESEQELSFSDEGDQDQDYVEFSSKKKTRKKNSTPNKKVHSKKLKNSDYVDDDDSLMQAIALSLQGSAGCLDFGNSVASQCSVMDVKESKMNETKGNSHNHEDMGKGRRKKSICSRVQMTEDKLIVHFFQFDEAGKGSITLRDIRRVAAAHDFTWTDKEMADMIYCFDSDGTGKLNLEDFHKIVSRCNMLKESENAGMGLKT